MKKPPPVLPEGQWIWRRFYVYAVSLGLLAMMQAAASRASERDLLRVIDGLMQLFALTLLLYLVAPTAQQLIELLAALRLRLRGRG